MEIKKLLFYTKLGVENFFIKDDYLCTESRKPLFFVNKKYKCSKNLIIKLAENERVAFVKKGEFLVALLMTKHEEQTGNFEYY